MHYNPVVELAGYRAEDDISILKPAQQGSNEPPSQPPCESEHSEDDLSDDAVVNMRTLQSVSGPSTQQAAWCVLSSHKREHEAALVVRLGLYRSPS